MTLVLLRDRDDEAEVRVDHQVLRLRVAALDPLRELDLLRRGEELVAACFVEEELQRVGRHRRDGLVREVRLVGIWQRAVVRQLDPVVFELLVEGLHLLVVELELGEELRERGEVDAAGLLAVLHERA